MASRFSGQTFCSITNKTEIGNSFQTKQRTHNLDQQKLTFTTHKNVFMPIKSD